MALQSRLSSRRRLSLTSLSCWVPRARTMWSISTQSENSTATGQEEDWHRTPSKEASQCHGRLQCRKIRFLKLLYFFFIYIMLNLNYELNYKYIVCFSHYSSDQFNNNYNCIFHRLNNNNNCVYSEKRTC